MGRIVIAVQTTGSIEERSFCLHSPLDQPHFPDQHADVPAHCGTCCLIMHICRHLHCKAPRFSSALVESTDFLTFMLCACTINESRQAQKPTNLYLPGESSNPGFVS